MAEDVDWDSRKAAANLKKHGVDFADDSAITVREDETGEERYVTIGMDAWHVCLLSCTHGAAAGRA